MCWWLVAQTQAADRSDAGYTIATYKARLTTDGRPASHEAPRRKREFEASLVGLEDFTALLLTILLFCSRDNARLPSLAYTSILCGWASRFRPHHAAQ